MNNPAPCGCEASLANEAAGMAAFSLRVQRRAEDGGWFDIPEDSAVLPNEPIRLVYGGFGVGASVVELSIIRLLPAPPVISYGPVRDSILLGSGNQFTTAADVASRTPCVAQLITVSRPWPFMEKPTLLFGFWVDPAAPAPPANPPGKWPWWATLAVVGAAAIVLVSLSPSINRGIRAVTGQGRGGEG